jgi:hypothetical protein
MSNTNPSFNPKPVAMKWNDRSTPEVEIYLPPYVYDHLSIDTHEVIDDLWGPEIQDYVLVKLDEIVDVLKQEHCSMLRRYRSFDLVDGRD